MQKNKESFPFKIELDRKRAERLIKEALREDVGKGDITTNLTVRHDAMARGRLVLKEDGVVAGLEIFEMVFVGYDADVVVKSIARDGDWYQKGSEIARIEGTARSLLTCERVALNFIQRLSGIATITRRFVDEISDTGVRILDTRKTTPCLRFLEKYAVQVGGGANHRYSLSDLVLIKDNHIKAAGGLIEAIKRVRESKVRVPVEVEVSPEIDLEELDDLDVDIVMLDNWEINRLRWAIERVRCFPSRPMIEVSGNVSLENVSEIAGLRPDFISIGSITHSSRSLDMSVEFED